MQQNKTLQLSKGNEVFLWGEHDDLKKYKKSDIVRILINKNPSSRCPWNDFALSFIFFRDGTYIKIPSMILSDSKIEYKMLPFKSETKGLFVPFCKLNN